MMTEAKAYISWKAAPAQAARTRRPRPSASYTRDHDWLLNGGARVDMTDRLDVPKACFSSMRGTPEEAFIAAIASSHMLAFLTVAAELGATVTSYFDKPTGILMEDDDGLRVVEVVLRPLVAYGAVPATPEAEEKLHEAAQRCSILGNSTTAKVSVYPAAVFTMAAQ